MIQNQNYLLEEYYHYLFRLHNSWAKISAEVLTPRSKVGIVGETGVRSWILEEELGFLAGVLSIRSRR